MEAEWIKQLVAEQLVSVQTKRGFTRLEWQKLRERNEVLDLPRLCARRSLDRRGRSLDRDDVAQSRGADRTSIQPA
jgi:hypothetical protein